MSIKYRDPAYADSRVKGTLCMLDGVPIIVHSVSNGGIVSYYEVGVDGSQDTCNISQLDVDPPEIGYVQNDMNSIYCMRVPSRRMKQGINQDSLKFIVNPSEKGAKAVRMESRPFVQCLKNQYLDIDRSLEYVYNGERVSSALSRNFSLSNPSSSSGRRDIPLVYKGRLIVGGVGIKTASPILKPKFQYLAEQMEKELL